MPDQTGDIFVIKNGRSFVGRCLRYFLIISSLLLVSVVFSKGTIIGKSLFFFVIYFVIISQPFIRSITIDKIRNEIIIDYYKFLLGNILRLKLREIQIAIKKQHAFRGGSYSILEISKERKVVFEFDSRDGIDLEELAIQIKSFQMV